MKYTELPCVVWIRGGQVQKGYRRRAALIIALAARIDNMSKADARTLLRDYYAMLNTSDFPESDVLRAADWAYNLETVAWSCHFPKEFGLCRPENCPFLQIEYSESDYVDVERTNQDGTVEHIRLPSTEAMLREMRKLFPDATVRTELIKHDGHCAVVKAIFENENVHLEAAADCMLEDANDRNQDIVTIATRRAIAKVLRYAGLAHSQEKHTDDGILGIFTVSPREFELMEKIRRARLAVEYNKYTRVR